MHLTHQPCRAGSLGPAVLASVAASVLVASMLLVAGCRAAPEQSPHDDKGGGAGPVVSGRPASLPASDVLRAWDVARAAAYAAGDVAALRRLYVPGSSAGTSDVRLLRGYLRRGFRVEGMRMQLLSLQVVRREPRRLVVVVTDRLAGAVAVGEGGRTVLPRDRASTRVVDLRRLGRGAHWQVAAVRESSRRPAAR